MQHKIIAGSMRPPEKKRQQKLHRQLGEFANWDAKTQGRQTGAERQAANVQARFEVAEILKETSYRKNYRDNPKYWMDFGNDRHTGQVILSTIGEIKQPQSEKYHPVASLPLVTEEFGDLLKQSELEDNTPRCSLAEALEKQDLFINSSLLK